MTLREQMLILSAPGFGFFVQGQRAFMLLLIDYITKVAAFSRELGLQALSASWQENPCLEDINGEKK